MILAGCVETAATRPAVATPPAAAVAAPGPLDIFLAFVGEAREGASRPIPSAAGHTAYVATIDRVYRAASGHVCKRVVLVGGGREIVRVACLEDGAWRLTPPLIEDDAIGVFNQPAV